MIDAVSSTSKNSGVDALKKLLIIIGAVSSASATAIPSDSVVGENNAILPGQEIIQTSPL